MANVKLDSVDFSLAEEHDFSWLKSFGEVFAVFDKNDSGNISFGVNSGGENFWGKKG